MAEAVKLPKNPPKGHVRLRVKDGRKFNRSTEEGLKRYGHDPARFPFGPVFDVPEEEAERILIPGASVELLTDWEESREAGQKAVALGKQVAELKTQLREAEKATAAKDAEIEKLKAELATYAGTESDGGEDEGGE